jgi:hypothetical protein
MLRKVEFGAAAVVTLLILYLSVRFFIHAGPLWRDEVNTINLATQPTYSDILSLLDRDSSPLLHPILVRLWSQVGWADPDLAMRFLGWLVALAMIATLWMNARVLGIQPPLLTLALFGAHAVTLRAVGSLRPYGLGALFMLLAYGAIWKLVSSPRAATFVYAATMAVLAVQTLYQNAILLLALCAAALVVLGLRRDWKGMALTLATGGAAAVSLLPYAGIVARSQGWRPLTQTDSGLRLVLTRWAEVFADASPRLLEVWVVLVVAGVAAATALLGVPSLTRDAPPARARVLFAVLATTFGVALYLAFMTVTDRYPHPWHFLSMIGLVALGLEVVFAHTRGLRWARAGLTVAVLVVLLPLSTVGVTARNTNVDLIATYVENAARPGDLIVVNPWFVGVSFKRYYRGDVAWMTLPPIEDLRVHRYDLLKERMVSPAPLAPVYDAIGRTLQSGHRVWLVGGLSFVPPGQVPVQLPPPQGAMERWRSTPYQIGWSAEAGYFVQTHAAGWWGVEIPLDQPIDPHEKIDLVVVEGWRRS